MSMLFISHSSRDKVAAEQLKGWLLRSGYSESQLFLDSELPLVLSEGEARCLSIAAFFAELATASDQSAILFDDPVSSLDHEWRENVARRLAEEAKLRQVIVFTHDIVFLHPYDSAIR